jgi:hypothetical protein
VSPTDGLYQLIKGHKRGEYQNPSLSFQALSLPFLPKFGLIFTSCQSSHSSSVSSHFATVPHTHLCIPSHPNLGLFLQAVRVLTHQVCPPPLLQCLIHTCVFLPTHSSFLMMTGTRFTFFYICIPSEASDLLTGSPKRQLLLCHHWIVLPLPTIVLVLVLSNGSLLRVSTDPPGAQVKNKLSAKAPSSRINT